MSHASARPGDLVFFHETSSPSSLVYHVGVYEGGDDMVAAATPSEGVRLQSFTWGGDTTRRTTMHTRTILRAFLILALAGGASAARALTQDELVARVKAAGYTEVSHVKSTAEGTTARAIKKGWFRSAVQPLSMSPFIKTRLVYTFP